LNPYISIVSALAVWSTWGLAVRALDAPATVIVFYNAVFSLVFQGAAVLYISRRENLRLTAGLLPVVALAGCGVVNMVFFLYALRNTSVAAALLTHYTAPVFVALFAPFLLGDRTDRKTTYAIAVSVAGLVLIFLTSVGGGASVGGGDNLYGILAGTASGLAYAFVIILSRGISKGHHPVKLVFYQGLVSVLALGAFVGPSALHAGFTASQGLVYAVLGLVHSTAGVMMYLYGIRRVSAQEAGVLGYLEPVLGILLAFMFLGETPHMFALAGGAMIIMSGTMIVLRGVPALAGGVDDYRG